MWLNLHSLWFFLSIQQLLLCQWVWCLCINFMKWLFFFNVESILLYIHLDVSANWNNLLNQLLVERQAAWGIISSRQFTGHHRPSANTEEKSNMLKRKTFSLTRRYKSGFSSRIDIMQSFCILFLVSLPSSIMLHQTISTVCWLYMWYSSLEIKKVFKMLLYIFKI